MNIYPAEVLRLFLLSKHYRSPLDFSKKDVLGLQTGLVRIYRTLQRLDELLHRENISEEDISDIIPDQEGEGFLTQFINFMDDDLNTAGAIGLIFETVKEINRLMDQDADAKNPELLSHLEEERRNLSIASRILGILGEKPNEFLKNLANAAENIDEKVIEKSTPEGDKAEAIDQSREGKKWAEYLEQLSPEDFGKYKV